MPQSRSGGSGSRGSGAGSGSRSTGASSGSRSTRAGSGSRSTRASSGRAGAAKSSGSGSSGRASASGTRSRSTSARPRKTSSGSKRSAGAGTSEAQFDAAAQRLRKLNEQIIEAAKDAGETALSSYEKALKTIAGSIERGPGKSDVEWISHLATAQAKFLRDLTDAWTKAARKMLK